MDLGTGLAEGGGECLLDGGVDVLLFAGDLDRLEPAQGFADARVFGLGEDSDLDEAAGVGEAAVDLEAQEARVSSGSAPTV